MKVESSFIILLDNIRELRRHENENEPKRVKPVSQWRAHSTQNISLYNLIVGAIVPFQIPNLLTD